MAYVLDFENETAKDPEPEFRLELSGIESLQMLEMMLVCSVTTGGNSLPFAEDAGAT